MEAKKKKIPVIIGISVSFVILLAVIIACVVLVLSGSNSKKIKKHFDLGEKYLNEMEYENAILEYENALGIDPQSVEAYLGLVDAYKNSGNFEKAMNYANEGYLQTGDLRFQGLINELQGLLENANETTDVEDSEILLRKIIIRVGSNESEYYYSYDTNNKLIKAPAYNANRGFTGWIEYYYNEDESLQKTVYTGDTEIDKGYRSEDYYNEKGDLIKTVFYNSITDKEYVTEYNYTYDEEGRKIKMDTYSNGSLSMQNSFEYDSEGNVIEEGKGVGNNISSSHKETHGNIWNSVIYNGDDVFCTMEGEKDDNGNDIQMTTYGPDGNEQTYIQFVYE